MRIGVERRLNLDGSKSVSEFLYSVKTIADELAIIDSPLSADDITLYVLNGLGPAGYGSTHPSSRALYYF